MYKQEHYIRYIKKTINRLNAFFENFFSKIDLNYIKKFSFRNIKNNNVIFFFILLFSLILIYFLFPTFYNKQEIKSLLAQKISKKYNIDLAISDNLSYSLFPKPHFKDYNSKINFKGSTIAKPKELKIFISYSDLFSIKKTEIKDIVFSKTNFNLNQKNYIFFLSLLDNKFYDDEIKIINGQVFYRNINDDVIFINSIKNLSIDFEKNKLVSVLESENEIFNIPYSININQDSSNKFLTSILNFKPLKLKINNKMKYGEKKISGVLDFSFINKNYSIEYEKEDMSFIFNRIDQLGKKMDYNFGVLNLKPFYVDTVLTLKTFDLKSFFSENSMFIEVLKSQILNNPNLNLEVKINTNSFKHLNNFENIFLKFQIKEGIINANKSKVLWDRNLEIEFDENYIFIEEGIIRLNGTINITVKNYKNFYSIFQTSKELRKKFKNIKLNFNYNLLTNELKVNNFYVDNNYSKNINQHLKNINLEQNNIKNWIDFKKYINEIIFAYSG